MALTPIDAAMGAAVEKSVNDAATVRFAEITAVDLVNLTVNIDLGGVPIINVPLMGGASPTVGDMGWLLYQGSMLVCIGPNTAAGGGSGGGPPTGSVQAFAGSGLPTGWLWCDGGSYDTTTYSDLFNAIGYTYGGSGANFQVPDMRDRSAVGAGASIALGATGGQVTINQVAAHSHAMTGSITVDVNNGMAVTGTAMNEQNGQSTGQNHGHFLDTGTLGHGHTTASALIPSGGFTSSSTYVTSVTPTSNTNTAGGGSLARVSSISVASNFVNLTHGHTVPSLSTNGTSGWSSPKTLTNGSHWHSLNGWTDPHTHTASHTLSASSTGESSVDIRNPYLGLNHIIKT